MAEVSVEHALRMGLAHHHAGRLNEAEGIYRAILAVQPNHARCLDLLGACAAQRGLVDEAIELLRRAIAGDPGMESAHFNLGRMLMRKGRMDEALACFREAVRIKPDLAEAYNDIGIVLMGKNAAGEALAAFERGVRLRPGMAEGLANMGMALERLGRREEAVGWLMRAVAIDPRLGRGWQQLGAALGRLGRQEEAVAAYQRALRIDANDPNTLNNLGIALRMLGRVDESTGAFRAAIAIKPDYVEAHGNLGLILDLQGAWREAIASYRRALAIDPGDAEVHSNLLYAMHFHPEAEELAREHRSWNQIHAMPKMGLARGHGNERSAERRLRVGYVSPDFRDHPVGRFMLPLVKAHDRGAVEVFCYADEHADDVFSRDFHAAADQWRRLNGMSDHEAAELIRADGVDILVDLTMHMAHNRLLCFAEKPAPVQATYLAYCSTTGLTAMDYRLSDSYLDPPEWGNGGGYSEETVRLASYWCYAAPLGDGDGPAIGTAPMARNGYVTFGCLNGFAKVSEEALAVWAEVLRAVPGSRLLLHANPGGHRERVKAFFAGRGVGGERIDFAGVVSLEAYLELYNRMDIALDPFPYAGGTTTCDGLWMGVPVITLEGKMAVGRGGVSILSNLGLTELIARDAGDYVRLAVDLAVDGGRVAGLRGSLRGRMRGSALMDAKGFARSIEAAFRQMWKKWCAGSR